MFVARDNDIGKSQKKNPNAKQWKGYDAEDRAQADMEKGIIPIPPPKKKKDK